MSLSKMDQCGRLNRIIEQAGQVTRRLEGVGAPLVDLAMRLVMARTFFRSGLQKLSNWDGTVFLFQTEYNVPVLPPELAASLAAATELTMQVLVVLGLATRLAALPMLGMALVIQFAVGAVNPAYDLAEHTFWIIVLACLIVRGAGPLSLDHLLFRRFSQCRRG